MANHINIEIKAQCLQPEVTRTYLKTNGAEFIGTDHQIDTYFNTAAGRFKLRQGNIENALIYYARPDQPGPKKASVNMMPVEDGAALKSILADAVGVRVEVSKWLEIYFICNVKFHIDEVEGLGSFMEIEAIDKQGNLGMDTLQAQCEYYLEALGVQPHQLLSQSYSEMLLKEK